MTASPEVSAAPASPSGPLDRRAVFSWCLYDWGNSAFPTVIITFFYSVFFARGIYGDETAGAAAWSYAIGIAGAVIAVISPVLGAIADHAGPRKPWLAGFTALCVLATAALFAAPPDAAWVTYVLVLVGLAVIAFELGVVFNNAMLTTIAPPAMLGRVSGWGWGLGYIGGLMCLIIALFVFVKPVIPALALPEDNAIPLRATTLMVAGWMALFCTPVLLFTPDLPRRMSARAAVGKGLRQLANTLRSLPAQGNLLRYFIASALYRDGLNTLFAIGGLYAAGTFGMDMEELILFAILLNVASGGGALAFAWIDDAIGSRRTVLIALGGLLVAALPAVLTTEKGVFYIAATCFGLFTGPAQAASRTLLARLAPIHLQTEMFGLYALTGKMVAFTGPLLFAIATDVTGTQRAGLAMVAVLIAVGGAVLLSVREPERSVEPATPTG